MAVQRFERPDRQDRALPHALRLAGLVHLGLTAATASGLLLLGPALRLQGEVDLWSVVWGRMLYLTDGRWLAFPVVVGAAVPWAVALAWALTVTRLRPSASALPVLGAWAAPAGLFSLVWSVGLLQDALVLAALHIGTGLALSILGVAFVVDHHRRRPRRPVAWSCLACTRSYSHAPAMRMLQACPQHGRWPPLGAFATLTPWLLPCFRTDPTSRRAGWLLRGLAASTLVAAAMLWWAVAVWGFRPAAPEVLFHGTWHPRDPLDVYAMLPEALALSLGHITACIACAGHVRADTRNARMAALAAACGILGAASLWPSMSLMPQELVLSAVSLLMAGCAIPLALQAHRGGYAASLARRARLIPGLAPGGWRCPSCRVHVAGRRPSDAAPCPSCGASGVVARGKQPS